jgi:uncharacterized delta-60 repeat protein
MKPMHALLLLSGLALCIPQSDAQEFDQQVANPGFETGTAPWVFFTNGAGTFSNNAPGYASPHAALVAITAHGTNTQLYQSDLPVESGYRYRLRFRAYSNTGHDLSVSMHKHTPPYTAYGLQNRLVDLTTEWQQFSIEFVASGFTGTVADGRLRFWFASYAADGDSYTIDDVELLKIRPEPPPVMTWVTTYGGPWADDVQQVQQTADGGYIVAGNTWSFGTGYSDFLILKLRADGSITWQDVYGGIDPDYARAIEPTSDGGYIVAGWTESFGAGSHDAWILKLRADGSIDWQRTYGGSAGDEVSSIQQSTDGGYIVAGWTESFGAGSRDAWVLKLRANGSIDWQKSYGGTGYEEASSIRQSSDGGYILAGRAGSFGAGLWDAWLLRLNPDGSVLWQKAYGSIDWDVAFSAQQTTDLGFIVSGRRAGDAWVCKLNPDGSVSWQNLYGGPDLDNYHGSFVQQTRDGGFIVAGQTFSFGAGSGDIWLLRLNANSSVSWQKTYGGGVWDGAASIQQTADGGYIVAGATLSFGAGISDGWILKVDSSGNSGYCPAARASNAVVSAANAQVTGTSASVMATPGVTATTAVTPAYASAEAQQICPASSNLIAIPGFETGTAPWKFYTDGAGTFANDAPGRASDRAARVAITMPGANAQLYQSGLRLQPNTRYRLSFWARSPSGHDLSAFLHKHTAPYTSYGLSEWTVDLTAGWQQFTRLFQTTGFSSGVADGRLRFWCASSGVAGDEFFIDDVELVWVGPAKESEQGDVPASVSLDQNYPNPFNPTTIIEFRIQNSELTILKVFDLLGREITTLINEVKQPGSYTVQWDASGVSSGVYFYRLRAGDFVQTRRMMILK